VSGAARDALEGDGVTEDDIVVAVSIRSVGDTLELDFAGTSPMVRGNVNCPAAVVRAASVFVLRTLLEDDVPTNDGIAAPTSASRVHIDARTGRRGGGERGDVPAHYRHLSMPSPTPGWYAGAGQGTMNNITFGGPLDLHETLGGGRARVPRPGAGRRARRDEQHAQHADRIARAGLSDPHRRIRRAARIGRSWTPPRR
jgi:N-methylhydantoinase B